MRVAAPDRRDLAHPVDADQRAAVDARKLGRGQALGERGKRFLDQHRAARRMDFGIVARGADPVDRVQRDARQPPAAADFDGVGAGRRRPREAAPRTDAIEIRSRGRRGQHTQTIVPATSAR
jgi:hypothetical protein